MKGRRGHILLLLFVPLFLQCRNEVDVLFDRFTPEQIARLIGDGIEPVEERFLFSSIEGSEHFIERFALTSCEQDIVGFWSFLHLPGGFYDPITGRGLGEISFFPNRLFAARRFFVRSGGSPEMVGRIQSIVGTWKIERGRLWIRFICRIIHINPHAESRNEMFAVEYWDDSTYFPIYNVHRYERFFINRHPFDMSRIPESVREFFEIDPTDTRRGRTLFDPIGIPPGDLRKESILGHFLLNPQITDEYMLLLTEAWRWPPLYYFRQKQPAAPTNSIEKR